MEKIDVVTEDGKKYDCWDASIDHEGRFMALACMDMGDTFNERLFVRDNKSGKAKSIIATGLSCCDPGLAISSDGKFVVFQSDNSLVENDNNKYEDIYVIGIQQFFE